MDSSHETFEGPLETESHEYLVYVSSPSQICFVYQQYLPCLCKTSEVLCSTDRGPK